MACRSCGFVPTWNCFSKPTLAVDCRDVPEEVLEEVLEEVEEEEAKAVLEEIADDEFLFFDFDGDLTVADADDVEKRSEMKRCELSMPPLEVAPANDDTRMPMSRKHSLFPSRSASLRALYTVEVFVHRQVNTT